MVNSLIVCTNRNNRIRAHRSNEFRRSKDYRSLTISLNYVNQLNHLLSIKSIRNNLIRIRSTSCIQSSSQSSLHLLINCFCQSFSNNLADFLHRLRAVQHSFEIDDSRATNSLRGNFESPNIKSECLVYTRQTNLGQELSRSVSANSLLKNSLLALPNYLNIRNRRQSVRNSTRYNFINSCYNNIVNSISIIHKLIIVASQISNAL